MESRFVSSLSRHPSLAKIGLLLAGTLAGLLVSELIVGAFWPQIFERHPRGVYLPDPEVGYVLTPGFRGTLQRSEFTTTIKIGREGLRGSDLRPRKPNSVRLLILGDSQVWGFGVEDHQTVSHQLEELLARRYPRLDIQVLNGGVPGYGTADELNFLRSRGKALDPDVVLLVFLPLNDFDENRVPATTWAGVEDGYLVWARNPNESIGWPAWLRLKKWLTRRSHVARLVSDTLGYAAVRVGLLRWGNSLWQTGEGFSARDAETAVHLLVQVARTAEELGARALFVYTTGQDRVLSASYEPPRSLSVVKEAARAATTPWVDVTPSLRARPDRLRLFFPRDGHWTASGHQAVAERLLTELVSLGFLEAAPGRAAIEPANLSGGARSGSGARQAGS